MIVKVGDAIRYRGLGSGVVTGLVTRTFAGSERVFAIIEFPHRELSAQVPLGDPGVEKRMSPVMSKTKVRRLVKSLSEPGERVSRTWEDREVVGTRMLREGGPEEWAALLRAYATARSNGLALAASDVELIREAQDLLAAELACACGIDYERAREDVRVRYQASAGASKSAQAA